MNGCQRQGYAFSGVHIYTRVYVKYGGFIEGRRINDLALPACLVLCDIERKLTVIPPH